MSKYKPDHLVSEKRNKEIREFQADLVKYLLMSFFFIYLFTFVVRVPWISLTIIIPWGVKILTSAIRLYGIPGFGPSRSEAYDPEPGFEREIISDIKELPEQLDDEEDEILDLDDLKSPRRIQNESDFL